MPFIYMFGSAFQEYDILVTIPSQYIHDECEVFLYKYVGIHIHTCIHIRVNQYTQICKPIGGKRYKIVTERV